MTDALWLQLLGPYLAGLLLSFGIELLLTPRPVPVWKRGWSAFFIHSALWTAGFGLELALFQRPWFGVANLLGLMLLLTAVNNTKFAMLREPFFYPDFEYFTDAIKHPRLYLPFFGLWKALLGVAVYGVALAVGLWLERPVDLHLLSAVYAFMPDVIRVALDNRAGWLLLCVAGFLIAGALLLNMANRRPINITFNAVNDLTQWGLLAALWRYRQAESETIDLHAHAPFSARPIPATPQPQPQPQEVQTHALLPATASPQPDLVMVQCESFFDVRRAYSGVRPDVLATFDGLQAQAMGHGRLHVPAWGANTVRTEYAVLSGVDPALMGVHRYNPYRRLGRHAVATMAKYLRGRGYKTICVHPYAVNFYRRHRSFPAMGFDVFLDIEAFNGKERFGPYVSDKAVADKVVELLGEPAGQPLFIYVITMENHGPLHWESVSHADHQQFFAQTLPAGCDDLVAYVRHIANADRLMHDLSTAMNASSRPVGLCIFGDHVPIMPAVYAALGEPDGTTDYLYWANAAANLGQASNGAACDLQAHELARGFLDHMRV